MYEDDDDDDDDDDDKNENDVLIYARFFLSFTGAGF